MQLNPYQSPLELGTKSAPQKWKMEAKAFLALALVALLFAAVAGGYNLYLEKMLAAVTMIATGLLPGTFFIVLSYRYQPHPLTLIAVFLGLVATALCTLTVALMLIAVLFLKIRL